MYACTYCTYFVKCQCLKSNNSTVNKTQRFIDRAIGQWLRQLE